MTQIILRKPVITEKATKLAQEKTYAIRVDVNANKNQIAEKVAVLYGVEIDHIRTVIRKGKRKRVGKKRAEKQKPHVKIAYITLKKGTLDIIPQ
jgi:large subunit ribosomal protein L23